MMDLDRPMPNHMKVPGRVERPEQPALTYFGIAAPVAIALLLVSLTGHAPCKDR